MCIENVLHPRQNSSGGDTAENKIKYSACSAEDKDTKPSNNF